MHKLEVVDFSLFGLAGSSHVTFNEGLTEALHLSVRVGMQRGGASLLNV